MTSHNSNLLLLIQKDNQIEILKYQVQLFFSKDHKRLWKNNKKKEF